MSMSNKIINESLINRNKYFPKKSMTNNSSEIKNDINNNKNKDLPSIKLKNQSNNCNIPKHLFVQKLVFNPITYDIDKHKRKSLLSPISLLLNKNKNYSSLELKPLSKKRLQPLSLKRSSSEIEFEKSSSTKYIRQNQNQISTNLISDSSKDSNKSTNKNDNNKVIKHKKLTLKIIDFLKRYKFRGHKDITIKNRYKYICNNKHIQEFKKSILDLYNKIGANHKKYLDNANFVHYFLFNTENSALPLHNSFSAPNKRENGVLSYEDITNDIKPKYEYIDYFGKENKIITRLTSNLNKINNYDINNNGNNNLKLNKQLKVPKLLALKSSEDYKNKNYIKVLQKKKKEKMKKEQKIIKSRNIGNIIDISKRGYEKLKNNQLKNFSGLIKYTIKEHKSVIKKLDDMIEVDKEQYEKIFKRIDSKSNDI